MPATELNVTCHLWPLDEPHVEWCDEHLLPGRIVQHYVFALQIGDADPVPHEVGRYERDYCKAG